EHWSLRYASAAMPRVANGLRMDKRLLRNRGDVVEAEYRWNLRKHPGAIRLLHYQNRAHAGTYAEDLAIRRNGTLKYGFGLNAEQEVSKDIGLFGRLGWND